jgi:DNA-binding IclR family transcriptional regulator
LSKVTKLSHLQLLGMGSEISMGGDKGKDTINSIDRALDILLVLQENGKEMGVTQISKELGIYKSTVYRTLAALERKNFVQQNSENGKYWLGLKLYSLGMLIREKMPLKNMAYPYAKALSDKFNEVVHISVLDKSAALFPKHIIIDKIESDQVLSVTPPIGSISACHCAAVGKCLMAFSDLEYIDRFVGNQLAAFTPNTITNWDKLLAELKTIRQQGYAIDDEELELGLTCVAAPILGTNQQAVAALSLSGPTARVKSAKFADIVREAKKTAHCISALLK